MCDQTKQGKPDDVVCVRMPAALKDALDSIAAAQGCTRTSLIVYALAERLELTELYNPFPENTKDTLKGGKGDTD